MRSNMLGLTDPPRGCSIPGGASTPVREGTWGQYTVLKVAHATHGRFRHSTLVLCERLAAPVY